MFKRLLREPLAHFLAIGLLLFLVFRVVGGDRSAAGREIVVSEQVVGTLVQQFSGVWQRQPTTKELQGLVDGWIREEVLYREGLQMGLDRDDPVIRRRVRQKVDVLAEESQPSQAPTDAELSQWLGAHAARYALAPVLSFEQAMIDPSRHANDLEKVTGDMQRRLQHGADPADATESHLLPARIADTPEDLVARRLRRGVHHRIARAARGYLAGPGTFGLRSALREDHPPRARPRANPGRSARGSGARCRTGSTRTRRQRVLCQGA